MLTPSAPPGISARDLMQSSARAALANLKSVLLMLAVLWALEAVDTLLFGQRLNQFGIRPRAQAGLVGIALAPLLHGSLRHLAANSLPFAVLAALILGRSRREFALVTAIVWLVSGLGVWLLGPANSLHIGASGVIFGWLGFLLLRALFDRQPLSIALALAVGAVYGGVLWGVLPSQEGISWQGHLSGVIGGALAARLISRGAG